MAEEVVSSDVAILDLLRKHDAMTVSQLADCMQVTATAVRQRLNRLMGQGHIDRVTVKASRGRPSHQYQLTDQGRRQSGANFADLAIALWQEIRAIDDDEVRRGLIGRIAKRLAGVYADQIAGNTVQEKMHAIVELFGERNIPFTVDESHRLPVLTALACPYPELAEQDRGICSMEKNLFAEILGEDVRLTQCRLDGENCCTFEVRQSNN